MARTIMIMAGGTGGHVFPALAVAEALRAAGWRVVWLGARSGMEANLVPARGFEMAWVRFSGLRGKGIAAKALLPLNLLIAFWQSARAIFAFRPHVVLGMGGYISFPGGMMASLFNRPLAIHEQNSVAGLANRVLAQVADRVLVAFPNTLAKGEFVGNPVRAEITRIPPPAERFATRNGPLRLLVVGGSLGAAALNDVVPKALAQLPEVKRPVVTHQSGVRHIEALRANYEAAGVRATLVPFIEDMAGAYADADLVICRAGATTVAELAATGIASLLVPFPFAVDDHQTTNARYLVDRRAALLEQQATLTPERLAGLLGGLTRDALLEMAERARAAARPDATEAVARACMELAK
ncbi:MAG: undecaprenyldiphospho-muramoylpentapeptide beta-N-acetylglucosaminyltransferase [Betaproteobacteria bacterium]|jgi:UDP-N-acetylglucosamine--N-acetylmuramyl-(pentapeptide) pyrophosphoryl-undecaprenol N-acetylglucosamine transferase|nr:undecaprenyldiphospho-muramoylpentapeptide beta-N-acetylglucosaminyltransferase [Betaproteobacteria bacterium]